MNAAIVNALTVSLPTGQRISGPMMNIGRIQIKVTTDWNDAGAYCLQARHVRHDFPIAENVQDAAALLGVEIDADSIEVGGFFARVTVSAEAFGAGNPLATALAVLATTVSRDDVKEALAATLSAQAEAFNAKHGITVLKEAPSDVN